MFFLQAKKERLKKSEATPKPNQTNIRFQDWLAPIKWRAHPRVHAHVKTPLQRFFDPVVSVDETKHGNDENFVAQSHPLPRNGLVMSPNEFLPSVRLSVCLSICLSVFPSVAIQVRAVAPPPLSSVIVFADCVNVLNRQPKSQTATQKIGTRVCV
jgi:hypothetical protein